MPETRYLTVAEVIGLHTAVLEKFGERSQGLRDEGLLESAVMRGRMAAYYEGADIVRQAVLVAVGISQSQPFVDGNKRAAAAAFVTLLDLNGVKYPGDPLEFARQLIAIAESGDREAATDQLEAWVREQLSAS